MRVSDIVRLVLAAASTVALGSCQTTVEQQTQASADICNVQHPATIQTVVDLDGTVVRGNVTEIAEYQNHAWATAVFVAEDGGFTNVYRCDSPRTICNNIIGVGGVIVGATCRTVTEVQSCEQNISLVDVRGLARVPTSLPGAMAEAERLALENCEDAADRFDERLGPDFNRSCVRLAAATCSFEVIPISVTTVTGRVVGEGGN